jgi:MFS superfamily sulfate permease-like transporter
LIAGILRAGRIADLLSIPVAIGFLAGILPQWRSPAGWW